MNTREAVPVMQQQAANTLPESFKNPVDVMTRALVAKRTSSLSPTSPPAKCAALNPTA